MIMGIFTLRSQRFPVKHGKPDLEKKQRLVTPKMYRTGDLHRCPVMIFNLYLSKRPVELRNKGPFYLGIIYKPQTEIWFKKTNMGKNKIDNIMRSMIKKSNIETKKRLTNHSGRKTLVKKLRKSFSKDETIQITGHSNTRGLDDYDSGNDA